MTIRRVLILATTAALFLSACATQPPEPTPEPEPVVVPEPVPEPPKEPEISRESLEALHGRVLALRKEAFELGLKETLPKDYAEADARYVSGKNALDADDRPLAKGELEAAEPMLERLLTEGSAALYLTRKSSIDAARERAMAANARAWSPEALDAAEATYDAAEALYEAAAPTERRSALEALARTAGAFDAVEKRSIAEDVKARVDELDYGPLDAGNYALAGDKLATVDSLIASDPTAARDASEEALLRYRLVLAKGWELAAGGRRGEAERLKLQAEDIKAQVAVKDDYAAAKAVWDSAVSAYAAGRHEDSVPLFAEAEARFQEAYEAAAAKRAAALAAIEAAKAKSEESAAIAGSGDSVLGIQPKDAPDADETVEAKE